MKCPYCFQPEGECFLVCPTQDPWGGDHALEDAQSQPDASPSPESLGGDIGPDDERDHAGGCPGGLCSCPEVSR